MRRLIPYVTAVCTLLLLTGPAWAQDRTERFPPAQNRLLDAIHAAKERPNVPEHTPPGHNRLAAPTNVLCPLEGGIVAVSADPVEGAAAYQMQLVCLDAEGDVLEDVSVFHSAPIANIAGFPLDDCVVVNAYVRAIPAPKHEGSPMQSGAPKGDWSPACVVEIPAL